MDTSIFGIQMCEKMHEIEMSLQDIKNASGNTQGCTSFALGYDEAVPLGLWLNIYFASLNLLVSVTVRGELQTNIAVGNHSSV